MRFHFYYGLAVAMAICAIGISGFCISQALAANSLEKDLAGRIVLQVESHGEAWYVNPVTFKRHYLGRPDDAFALMRQLGLGISNKDLQKIPLGISSGSGADSDGDGLSNAVESALQTDPNKTDSDGDGHFDATEVANGYDPLAGNNTRLPIQTSFAKQQDGKILLQVESHGEAWYINPLDHKRYFLGRPADAFALMRQLGLGISDANIAKITDEANDQSDQSQTLPSPTTETGCAASNPVCDDNYNCVNNVCVLKTGCTYNNPACKSNYHCVNNKCEITITGCANNSSLCKENYYCANNKCVLKKGCDYKNPSCSSSYQCIENQCILKAGCAYKNPLCGSRYSCVSNQCVLKTGCTYDNPACGANYDCTSNKCVLKKGCDYKNPACSSKYQCSDNKCVLKTGCATSNPACDAKFDCVNNACVLKKGCTYNNPGCGADYNCTNNKCVLKTGCNYNNPVCGSGYNCVDNVCSQYSSTTSLNLEVVFFNVNSCYVAEECTEGQTCDVIKDYRLLNNVPLFYFKAGTLKMLSPTQAVAEGYGETGSGKLKYCIHTSFDNSQMAALKENYDEVTNYIYSWTNHGLKIIPHFRTVEAEFSSGGPLNKDQNSLTGFTQGQSPPYSEVANYAIEAGVDLDNMDMFVSLINNYPTTGSANDGLVAQQGVGGTGGEFHGVAVVMQMGMEWNVDWANNCLRYFPLHRDLFIPIAIHELTHVINMGHYSISRLTDVYGIENSQQGEGYNQVTNPRPHCTSTKHYTNGKPDRYKYFSDSYYWLDPMFNTKPFEPYPASGAFSFCNQPDDANKVWPTVNPLNPNDHYEDIKGFPDTMKYYKFIYQAHYSPAFAGKFYTNSYRKGLPDYPIH